MTKGRKVSGVRCQEERGWGREQAHRVKSRARRGTGCGLRVARYGCGISRTQRAKRIGHGAGKLIWRMTKGE